MDVPHRYMHNCIVYIHGPHMLTSMTYMDVSIIAMDVSMWIMDVYTANMDVAHGCGAWMWRMNVVHECCAWMLCMDAGIFEINTSTAHRFTCLHP